MEKTLILSAVQQVFSINHSSDIGMARRSAMEMADDIRFDETASGKLAIVITEVATNILKHAGEGKILIGPARRGNAVGIEVLGLDSGPGISDLSFSLRDGSSSTGTSGTGLGAMARLSNEFDLYTSLDKGSAFYMCILPKSAETKAMDEWPLPLQVGAVCLPIAGEDQCGDAWGIEMIEGAAILMVTDGLGHGPEAAEASRAAIQTMHRQAYLAPGAIIEAAHLALRGTRGAAVAVAKIDLAGEELRFAGIGNISACVIDSRNRKHLVSHNGIVGHNMRKAHEFSTPFGPEQLCLMHSDGLTGHWDLHTYPGLFNRHPALIAGVLYRDYSRGRDDVTVVVARQSGS